MTLLPLGPYPLHPVVFPRRIGAHRSPPATPAANRRSSLHAGHARRPPPSPSPPPAAAPPSPSRAASRSSSLPVARSVPSLPVARRLPILRPPRHSSSHAATPSRAASPSLPGRAQLLLLPGGGVLPRRPRPAGHAHEHCKHGDSAVVWGRASLPGRDTMLRNQFSRGEIGAGEEPDGGGGEAMEKSPPEPASAAAAEEVAARFRSLVDPHDVASMRQTQHLILGRLQDSNAVLTHFNEYSEQCFAEVSSDFASKTRLLKSMKADLEHIFTKLRGMKSRLAATYPDAFPDGAMSKTMDQRPDLETPLD